MDWFLRDIGVRYERVNSCLKVTLYVDDTICFVKIGSIEYFLSVINNFHEKIQSSYEIEKDSELSFLDVEIQRINETLATTVYRKEANNDMYLNWNSFSPDTWKKSTFRTLIERAYVICSTPKLRRKEINHLKYVFRDYNNYPMWVINQIENKKYLLLLPYHVEIGNYVIKSLKKQIRKLLPENIKAQVTHTGTKLDTCFNLKDQTKFEHKNDIIYHGECLVEECPDNYIGETKWRMFERISGHNGRDISSYLLKHAIKSGHRHITGENFKIINNGLSNNTLKRRIAESLLIKEKKPTLNKQVQSLQLKLYN